MDNVRFHREKGEEFFRDTPLIQMYGMTETAGQIASMPLPPANRVPHSLGRAAGPEVALIDEHGAVVATGRSGEICVRGETVTAGYEGDAPTPHHGDWLRTGDLGQFDADGTLYITGRVKEIIRMRATCSNSLISHVREALNRSEVGQQPRSPWEQMPKRAPQSGLNLLFSVCYAGLVAEGMGLASNPL